MNGFIEVIHHGTKAMLSLPIDEIETTEVAYRMRIAGEEDDRIFLQRIPDGTWLVMKNGERIHVDDSRETVQEKIQIATQKENMP